MAAQLDGVPCHAKTCTELASVTCDRCGQQWCTNHIVYVTVQRREQFNMQSPHFNALSRLPLRTETYALCPLCKGKPVQPRALRTDEVED